MHKDYPKLIGYEDLPQEFYSLIGALEEMGVEGDHWILPRSFDTQKLLRAAHVRKNAPEVNTICGYPYYRWASDKSFISFRTNYNTHSVTAKFKDTEPHEDTMNLQPIIDAAIAANPKPLMFVATLPYCCDQAIQHRAKVALNNFSKEHGLPPFLVVVEGVQVKAMIPSEDVAALRKEVAELRAMVTPAKPVGLSDVDKAMVTYSSMTISTPEPTEMNKSDLAKMRAQIEESLKGSLFFVPTNAGKFSQILTSNVGTSEPVWFEGKESSGTVTSVTMHKDAWKLKEGESPIGGPRCQACLNQHFTYCVHDGAKLMAKTYKELAKQVGLSDVDKQINDAFYAGTLTINCLRELRGLGPLPEVGEELVKHYGGHYVEGQNPIAKVREHIETTEAIDKVRWESMRNGAMPSELDRRCRKCQLLFTSEGEGVFSGDGLCLACTKDMNLLFQSVGRKM